MNKKFIVLIIIFFWTQFCSQEKTPLNKNQKKSPESVQLNICMQNPNLTNFFPYSMKYYNDSQLYDLIYNTLIKANFAGNLSPEIAQSWEISPTEYTFFIRKDIRFHNQKRLTTDDIFFTLEQLILNTHTHHKELLYIEGVEDFIKGRNQDISGLVKIDDFCFKIKLKKKFNYLLHFLSAKFTSIIPDDFAGLSLEDFQQNPIGTGPFIFRGKQDKTIKHRPFLEFTFTKNSDYFDKSGNIDKILFYIPFEREKLKTLLYFDLFLEDVNFTQEDLDGLLDRNIISTPPDLIAFLSLNPIERQYLGNRLIRQLINYSINREKLTRKLLLTHLIPAHLMIPASLFGYNPYYRIHYATQKKILPAIKQKEISFTLLIHPGQNKIAGILKTELGKNGIKVNIQTISTKEYYLYISKDIKYSIIVEGLPDYPSAYNFLSQLYEKDNILNYFQIDSPKILDMIKKLPEIDIKQQANTLKQINYLIEEESLYIPLFYYYDNIIIKDRIKKLLFKYAGTIDFSSIEVKNEYIN